MFLCQGLLAGKTPQPPVPGPKGYCCAAAKAAPAPPTASAVATRTAMLRRLGIRADGGRCTSTPRRLFDPSPPRPGAALARVAPARPPPRSIRPGADVDAVLRGESLDLRGNGGREPGPA